MYESHYGEPVAPPAIFEQAHLHNHKSFAGPCRHKLVEQRCASCVLDDSYYFANLDLKAKLALQQSLKLKHFRRRDIIYSEGDMCQDVLILVTGEVKIFKSLSNGRQQIHRLAMIPGDLLACEDLFLDIYSSGAEAISSVTACCLKKTHFRAITEKNRKITDTLLQAMARNINAYIQHISNLGQKKALERVASYLIFLGQTHLEKNLDNGHLRESLTRQELADMLGVTQRTLIRCLRKLEKDEVISLTDKGFMLLDYSVLSKIAEGQIT